MTRSSTALLAIFAAGAIASTEACSSISNGERRRNCEAWSDFANALGRGAEWGAGQNPCGKSNPPLTKSLVQCAEKNGISVLLEINLNTAVPGLKDLTIVDPVLFNSAMNAFPQLSGLEYVELLDFQNLTLTQCFPDACSTASGLTCSFQGSDCTAPCGFDGQCVPTESPTASPTAHPTNAPVESTDAPTSAPTESPVVSPTDAPTTPLPTGAPVASPTATDAPTSSSTDAPTSASTDAPTSASTDAPVTAPSQSPTTGGTSGRATPQPTTVNGANNSVVSFTLLISMVVAALLR